MKYFVVCIIQTGQIVLNLISSEPVTVNKIQPLGSMISIKFTGVNSKRANTKVISKEDFETLEILTEEGTFNFKGDPKRLAQLGNAAWLYIVLNCKSKPELFCIQNPAKKLNFQLKSKGVQYFLAMDEWKSKLIL